MKAVQESPTRNLGKPGFHSPVSTVPPPFHTHFLLLRKPTNNSFCVMDICFSLIIIASRIPEEFKTAKSPLTERHRAWAAAQVTLVEIEN